MLPSAAAPAHPRPTPPFARHRRAPSRSRILAALLSCTLAACRAATADADVALRSMQDGGRPTALYVPVEREGRPGLLHLDSASATTLVFLRDAAGWRADAGSLRIGGVTRQVPGYGGLGTLPDVDGLPVIGMAGADLLLEQPCVVDVQARCWRRDPRALAALAGAEELPFELVQGVVLVSAAFDGVPVRLVLDTGSAHSLWLGQAPAPGDRLVVTEDALGGELRVHEGRARLTLGAATRRVPILRAPSFPVLEELARRLAAGDGGAEIVGLLGLSSLTAFHVDVRRRVVRVVPAGDRHD